MTRLFRRAEREPIPFPERLAVHMAEVEPRRTMIQDIRPRNPIDWGALVCLFIFGLCGVALVIHAIAGRML